MTEMTNWRTIYGPGILARECRAFTSTVVLTSPSAWRAVAEALPAPPLGIAFVTNQEEDYLAQLPTGLPDADMVLGVGGGKALDAAKYVAWKKGVPLALIPTIVSTGAIFNTGVPARRQGKIHILQPALVPEVVLFDTDVIRAAPPRLNAAGMGECICWVGVVASWHWWTTELRAPPAWDEGIAQETLEWVRSRVGNFTADLDDDGRPGPAAIRTAAEVNRERNQLRLGQLNISRTLCHIFDNTFLWTHRRELRHGEAVALGTLMGCFLYDWGLNEAKAHLTACGTRFRPREIGCTWEEVRATLQRIPAHHAHLQHCVNWAENYLNYRAVDDATFARMTDRIDAD